MSRIPSLTSLRTFEAAARLCSFKEAALELNFSTSAISHQIRTLEENLDIVLFIRNPGGVALTDAGQLYLGHVRVSLESLEAGAAALKRMQNQDKIRLSLLSSFSTLWLIPNLLQFYQEHPGISVELDDDVDIIDFSVASFDAALRYDFSGTGHWHDVTAHPLFEEWIVPVCSPDYLQKHPEIIRFDLDDRHTVLVNRRHPDEWQQWFRAQKKPIGDRVFDVDEHSATTVMDTSNMTLMAACKGMGIALGRTPFVDQYLESSELVRVHSGVQYRGVRHYLVYPAKTSNVSGFIAFRDWLVQRAWQSNEHYAKLGTK